MTTQTTKVSTSQGWLIYAALIGLLVVVMAGGYGVFRVFALIVMPDLGAYNLLALAVIAGTASFFSPCAFPLLPGYLSIYYAGVDGAPHETASKPHAMKLGLSAAAGVVTFNIVLGVIIGILGTGITEGLSITSAEPTFIRTFRGLVGVVLVGLGIAQLKNVNLKPMLADALAWRTRPRRDKTKSNPAQSVYLYGLGYNAAGMGCTAPILAGLVVFALASGGFSAALSAFVVFSITMGTLMLFVSLLVATSHDTAIRKLKAASPRIKTIASVLLIGVGLFNIVTSIDVTAFVRLLFP